MSEQHEIFPSLNCRGRINWVDHTRGFVLINTTIFWLLPITFRRSYNFFMAHPLASPNVNYMNYHDVGLIAYVTIMGMMMARSFAKRRLSSNSSKALFHLLFRYTAIFFAGLFLVYIEKGDLVANFEGRPIFVSGIPVIEWGVFLALGTVGLVATLFQLVPWKIRLTISIVMVVFYQYMLMNFGWREYATASAQGGALGSLFSLSGLMLGSTVMGEIIFCNDLLTERKKLLIIFSTSIACGLIAFFLCHFPEFYPNRRQMTLPYLLIGFGITLMGTLCFIGIDRLYRRSIPILDGFGRNAIAVFTVLLIAELLEQKELFHPTSASEAILIVSIFAVVMFLEKKNITIKL
jgi:hypothetical protein